MSLVSQKLDVEVSLKGLSFLLTELFARDSEHPHIKVVPMVQNEVYQ
jgi:hypothetical protein